jgi:hypothetical protein
MFQFHCKYCKILLIQNSRDQKMFLNYEEALEFKIEINSKQFIQKKSVSPLFVLYVVACQAITVTNYHFMWRSVV